MADFVYEGPATVGDDQLEAWEIQGQPIDDEGAVVRQIWGDIPPEGQEYGDAVLLAQFVDRVNPLIIGIERRGTEARLQQDAPAGPLEGEMFRFPQGFLTIKRIDTRNPDKPAGIGRVQPGKIVVVHTCGLSDQHGSKRDPCRVHFLYEQAHGPLPRGFADRHPKPRREGFGLKQFPSGIVEHPVPYTSEWRTGANVKYLHGKAPFAASAAPYARRAVILHITN